MGILEDAKNVLEIEIGAIRCASEKLDKSFVSAVEMIYNCTGKVVVSGLGKSGLIGRKIAATLASTGTPAIFMHPSEGVHGDLGIIMKRDVVVLVSKSGETEEILRIIPSMKRIGVQILSFVGRPESTLAKYSNVFIDVSVEKEACPNNLAPTASTTTLLAMGDALAVSLVKKRGFNQDDFACLHPGGILGRRLLIKVDDIMHFGDRNAVVLEDQTMKEAIIEMTSKGLGAVSVIDSKRYLVGIITDGDLRRAIELHDKGLLKKSVKDIMTKNPISVLKNTLAVDALNLMEDRLSQISILPVIDKNNLLIGMLRLHDLVKANVL